MESDVLEGVCYDCFAVIAGFEPVDEEEATRFQAASEALDDWQAAFEDRNGFTVHSWHVHGDDWGNDSRFSWVPCSCCHSSLGGDRFDLALLYETAA